MDYYKLGFVGLMMLCFGIPVFFISTTDMNGGNFKMNEVSYGALIIDIIGMILCVYSYSTANKILKQQSRQADKQNRRSANQ